MLPKSESEEMKPDEVFEVSAGDDPNKKKPFANNGIRYNISFTVYGNVRVILCVYFKSRIWANKK